MSRISYRSWSQAVTRQPARACGNFSGMSSDFLHLQAGGEIELSFHALDPTGPGEEADLEALGAIIVDRLRIPPEFDFPPIGLIQAWVPFHQVREAAALAWVAAVTPPSYGVANPHPVNPINSAGVPLHNANVAQSQGVTGAGVTVGVISVGATSVAQAQARNELPMVTVGNTAGGDEGTAMLEIVHDMAPGAALLYDDGAGTDSMRELRHFECSRCPGVRRRERDHGRPGLRLAARLPARVRSGNTRSDCCVLRCPRPFVLGQSRDRSRGPGPRGGHRERARRYEFWRHTAGLHEHAGQCRRYRPRWGHDVRRHAGKLHVHYAAVERAEDGVSDRERGRIYRSEPIRDGRCAHPMSRRERWRSS